MTLGSSGGTGGGFTDLFSKGLDAWVDVERVKAYRPNDPTPGSYGPTAYGTAGQGNYSSETMSAGAFPVGLVLVAAGALVLLLLLRR